MSDLAERLLLRSDNKNREREREEVLRDDTFSRRPRRETCLKTARRGNYETSAKGRKFNRRERTERSDRAAECVINTISRGVCTVITVRALVSINAAHALRSDSRRALDRRAVRSNVTAIERNFQRLRHGQIIARG